MQWDYYANFLNTDKATADKAEKCIKYKNFSETSNTIVRKKKTIAIMHWRSNTIDREIFPRTGRDT